MAFPFAYCPHGSEVLPRLRALYERRATERIFAAMAPPSQALAAFAASHADGYCEYPETGERLRFWDDYLRERAAVRDDSIPSAYLSEMDQGLYGALVGGEVRFLCDPATGWISSMVPAVLNDWSELAQLSLGEDHPWFQRYRTYLDQFAAGSRGKFGISHFILISGLNFVFELVGATQTYLALADHPELVRQAIELGRQVNLRVQETFFERIPLLEGGTCSNMVEWIPGRIVSESVDPFHMTSVDYFERWGRENLERIYAHFDGGVLHLHANGRHLLPAVSTVKGLKAVNLSDDRGFPSAFSFLPEARRLAGGLPFIVAVEYDEFSAALQRGELVGGVLYKVRQVPDADTANRSLDRVRAYRWPG